MKYDIVMESASFVKDIINEELEIGIILGSGLGSLASEVTNAKVISYSDIPNFPVSTVQGHAGQFVVGDLCGKKVIMMQGRFHYYEGNPMSVTALPVYVMKELGIKTLIVTNAAGGVNTQFKPGNLMIIKDHINFSGVNPLIGENDDEIGPRFPDMSVAYSRELTEVVKKAAKEVAVDVVEGTYVMMSGPSYETPAEIRMLRILGGDAVGMSTVPEAIAASHCGIKTIGISCITNMAAGILDVPLNHQEVMETSAMVKEQFISLIKKTLELL